MTPEQLDQLALEIMEDMGWRWNKDTFKPDTNALLTFARRYRKALKEKAVPIAYVAANGSHVELADGIDATSNWTDYYTKPLYSLEDF